jgi:hypothetical protein
VTPTDTAHPAPKPTLFISYASEDREAARRLRDSLAVAGLDVWYDENELGGGDSWDQKIRRQIRDCDYFMPVISANTVRRKEGYFRREWRLATERTLDMADDVMFLLPVCIDGTQENNARVPEKFLSVQWLRAPDGAATPALENLARRLAAGEHLAPTPPRGRAEPPVSRASSMSVPPLPASAHAAPHTAASHDGPPPMPAFPHVQGKGMPAGLKFLAEVIWWVISAAWLLLRPAPKWVRGVVSVWFIFSAISVWRSASSSPPPKGPIPAEKKMKSSEVQAEIAKARKALNQSGLPAGLTQFGDEMAKRLAAELKNSEASGKQIVAIPFASGVTDPVETKFLTDIFTPLWGRLSIERSGDTGLIATPVPSPTDTALVALGQRLDATFVLGARILRASAPTAPATGEAAPAPPASAATLEVTLVKSESGAVAWSEKFPMSGDPTAVGTRIADAVLAATKPH